MKYIIKGKWIVLLVWIIVIAALVITAPSMSKLVREKGQITVPNGYSSSQASQILSQMHQKEKTGNSLQVALVFHRNKKLSQTDLKDIKHGINELNNHKKDLGITSITSYFSDASLKNKLVSKDGKTMLASIEINKGNQSENQLRAALTSTIKDVKVPHYYTGDWMINGDLITSSQEGLHKTEWLTIIFILAVLFIVFRSAIAPIIPLVSVGVTFITTQSIVAFLVDKFNFPLSTFTQIFLVAVLFGIGTDYCILLLSRFKEELAQRESVTEAIIVTYKNAGRTVFFSGLAVFIGFSTIGLSTFKLYQSGAAVAVGVAVLIIALFTIVPFFMALLGRNLFWPGKRNLEHKQSRMWGFAGRFTFMRPLMTLIIIAIVIVPFLITYNGKLSFNSLDELGDGYQSVKAFNIISNAFGPGESMPTKVVIKNDVNMDQPQYLALLEKMTREISNVNGVKTVRSVTQPTGDPVNSFLVKKQASTLKSGIKKSNDGIKKISSGLKDASSSLQASTPKLKKSTSGIDGLIKGTNDLKSGVASLSDNLKKIETGMKNGTEGVDQIKQGLAQAKNSAQKLADNSQQLLTGYKQMANGLGKIETNYNQIQQGLNQGLTTVKSSLEKLAQQNPALMSDPNYQTAYGATVSMLNGTKQSPSLVNSMAQLNTQLNNVITSFNSANAGYAKLVSGQQSLTDGLNKLVTSLGSLETGLKQATSGQSQIISNIPSITNGLTGIVSGQQQLKSGFGQLNTQLGQLTGGLNSSVTGLNKVSSGLSSTENYLNGLSSVPYSQIAGWYLPPQTLQNKSFQQALNTYMSKDRKVTTMDVIFKTNPYSTNTLDKIKDIKSAINRVTKGTKLENAKIGIGGITSINNDLRQISKADYTRTVILMLIGVGLILIGLMRSLIMPIYIIGSLILTYFTAMGITEIIFVDIFHYPGVSWSMPFFGFVMLVALGVDYSIFLMDRFNEYKDLPVREAMILAMKKMGTVILSAVVILGGTFAAMIPSGVLSLMEIATIVIAGLILYAFIFLPLFMPLMVKTFGKANWWPFRMADEKDE